MSEDEYSRLIELVKREFGLLVKGDKRLTFHAKLSHRLEILGLASYGQYINFIQDDPSGQEIVNLVSHVTNNETYFFRERPQLEFFAELLKEIKRQKQKENRRELKILSLACSSGEEPYTLNIILMESGLFIWDWDLRVEGIDINMEFIERAKRAIYGKGSFRTMNGDEKLLGKYFHMDENRFVLKRAFARNVGFRQGNILRPETFDGLRDVDVVFCRNVLIYMNDGALKKVVGNLYDCMSDSGYLFLGLSESLIQRTGLFLPEYRNGVIVYRKNVKD